MTLSTLFDEIVPMVKELQEDCAQLTKEEFENLRKDALKEAQTTGNVKLILALRAVFLFIENELIELRLKENAAYE